ncbi:MAG: YggU family protein [Thermoplasmata archaeon]|nr:MAG: YggU family protein [Thermoplasmata archaeon]KAA0014873.1 MAG: YggU family protein [Thermoplasmata archaeon]OYT62094.1 MAG: YggU family protein [Thermoplasmatales archaeon ex4484_30]
MNVEETKEGCILHIKVKIGKQNKFPAGYDSWRERIEIEINEEPVKGKANKKIEKMVAEFFNAKTCIIYGAKAREKGILVKKKKEEVIHLLENGL